MLLKPAASPFLPIFFFCFSILFISVLISSTRRQDEFAVAYVYSFIILVFLPASPSPARVCLIIFCHISRITTFSIINIHDVLECNHRTVQPVAYLISVVLILGLTICFRVDECTRGKKHDRPPLYHDRSLRCKSPSADSCCQLLHI